MNALVVHFHGLRVEIHNDFARADHALGMAFGATHNGGDAGDQLVLVEWLGEIVVGAVAERLHLRFNVGIAGEDHHRRVHTAHAQLLEHFVPGNIRQ